MPSSSHSSSWSDSRGGGVETKDARGKEKLRRFIEVAGRIDSALVQLASDRDFQQDLRVAEVAKALKHWTGRERLDVTEAEKLFDVDSYHFRTHIRPCLAKLARLQHECKQADVALPLDRVLCGCRTLVDPPFADAHLSNGKGQGAVKPAPAAPSKANGGGELAAKAAVERRRQGWRKLIWWMQAYGVMLLMTVVSFTAYVRLAAPNDATALNGSSGSTSATMTSTRSGGDGNGDL